MYEYIIYARECDAIRRTIAASLSSSSPYDGDGVRGDDVDYLANDATMTTTLRTTRR